MTTPAYHSALRDIRAQFRAGEFEGAYLNAAALARAHPDVEEIGTFLAGAARKLNASAVDASVQFASDILDTVLSVGALLRARRIRALWRAWCWLVLHARLMQT